MTGCQRKDTYRGPEQGREVYLGGGGGAFPGEKLKDSMIIKHKYILNMEQQQFVTRNAIFLLPSLDTRRKICKQGGPTWSSCF